MKTSKKLRYLSRSDVEEIGLGMEEIIGLVEKGLIEKGEGRVEMPPKPGLHPQVDAFIHAMPCYLPRLKACGMKWVSGFPNNHTVQLPYISGLLILNSPETGLPLAVMDCTWITAKRTAAASAVSARYLIGENHRTLAIIGCGVQGREHLEALQITCPQLERALVYDVKSAVQKQYVEDLDGRYSLAVMGVSNPQEAITAADVIVTSGPILKNPSPTLKKEWLQEGALGIPIDFDSYWEPSALHKAERFYVDDRDQFAYYRGLGYFQDVPLVYGDLGELVTGHIEGRKTEGERLISMNLGIALEDMVTAKRIYDLALEKKVGTLLQL